MNSNVHQGTVVVTRPPHFPTMHTRDVIKHLAAFGAREELMCAIIRCTAEELQRHYADELTTGLERINAQVQNAVLHKALYENDLNAMKLWLVNKAGWRTGDGKGMLPGQPLGPGELPEGQGLIPVSQRRELISELLTKATRFKRDNERVIDAEVIPAKKNGNGADHR